MTRKSFLMAVWEGGGNIPPVLSVAAKLLAAGHEVRILSDACNRPEIEATGAEFIAWTRAPSRPDKSAATDIIADWEPKDPVEGLGRVFERIMFGPAALFAADAMEEIARRKPDLVITNEMLFGVMAASEASGVPFSLFCPNVSLFPVEGVPPIGPGLPPPQNEAETRLHAQIAAGNAAMFNKGLQPLNAARDGLGLPALSHVFEQVERAAQVLLGTARAFDFAPAHLPSRFHYVGPQFYDPSTDEIWESPFGPVDDADPLVLLSFSTTFQNQGAVLQRVIAALADARLRLLVTLGPALEANAFDVPKNVRLVARAPHRNVMQEARLVIAHGGHGTVMRALSQDCPLLVIPMGRDQNDNAVRVQTRGTGLVLNPEQASEAEIRAAVMRLLSEPSFGDAAKGLGAQIRVEAEASPIVRLLEEAAGECPAQAAA